MALDNEKFEFHPEAKDKPCLINSINKYVSQFFNGMKSFQYVLEVFSTYYLISPAYGWFLT